MSNIIQADCLSMRDHVAEGSLDAIFTDPPYPKEYLYCYRELADFAVHALRPGGVLLTMAGQMFLPEVIELLKVDGLSYRWSVAYVYRAPQGKYHATKVTCGWKPILVYKRDGAHPDFYSKDTFKVPPKRGRDKASHVWGQNIQSVEMVAREWLRPGWKVCDPFVGAGSLLVAAKRIGCEVIGCDVDAKHVRTALQGIGQENLL